VVRRVAGGEQKALEDSARVAVTEKWGEMQADGRAASRRAGFARSEVRGRAGRCDEGVEERTEGVTREFSRKHAEMMRGFGCCRAE